MATFVPRRPLNADTFNDANNLDIRVNRSKMMADLLTNRIAHNERLPGSGLEGASRVVAALVGGHQRSISDSAERERRETLASVLGGENMTTAERYAYSSGDPSLIRAAIAQRMASDNRRDPIEEKYKALVAAGVPPARARALASGAIVHAQDGTAIDYTQGFRYPGNGMDPVPIGGSTPNTQPPSVTGATLPPAATAPDATPAPVANAPLPPPVTQAAPPASVPPPGTTPLPGRNLTPGQATRTAAEKDVSSADHLNAVLADLEANYDPSFLTAPGQLAASAENAINRMGGNVDLTNRNRRHAFNSAVGRAFDAYRKDITGAAAAQQELDRLQQNFLSTEMSPQQFKVNLRMLRMLGERNRQINVELLARGIRRDAPNYDAEFTSAMQARPLSMNAVVEELDREDREAGVGRFMFGARRRPSDENTNENQSRARTYNPATGKLE